MTFLELQEIKADMPLPLEMEQKLARTLATKRSARKLKDNAVAMLVRYSMREAFLYAGKCGKGQLSAEQLTSLSYLGLCKAAKNFKPGQLRFFSYAKIYVRSEVFRHFRDASIIRNVKPEMIQHLAPEQHRSKTDVTAVSEKGVVSNRCGGEASVGFEFDSIYSTEIWERLLPLIRQWLTPKEYHVVTRHYIDDLNFREIGDELGDSRSWAQILHARAMKKIRQKENLLRTELDR